MHMHCACVRAIACTSSLFLPKRVRARANQSFLLDGENGQKDLGNGLNVLNVLGNIDVVRAGGSGTSWNKTEPTESERVRYMRGSVFFFHFTHL